MQVTGKMLLELEEHARKIGTRDQWISVAKEWIAEADKHISKITPVYTAVMEWKDGEASLDALKHIIRTAQNDVN